MIDSAGNAIAAGDYEIRCGGSKSLASVFEDVESGELLVRLADRTYRMDEIAEGVSWFRLGEGCMRREP